ncbi:MAG: response regulator [Acidobacteriota bacterium]
MAKTLLLADDSVTIQRVIELTFAHEDVRVVSVSDGRRAVEWMNTDAPDIVLVDVEVPEIDGYALTTHIKTSPRLKHVPVLLLAGAFEPVDHLRAERAGCDGVIVKPFEPQQLVGRVKDLLAHAGANAPGSTRVEGPRDAGRRPGDADVATVTPFPTPLPVRVHEAFGGPAPGHLDAGSNGASARAGRGGMEAGAHAPEPLEPPSRPVWETAGADGQSGVGRFTEAALSDAPSRISLVNAFTALLAAEQSSQPVAAAPAPFVSDVMVEEAVRRVLTRMTDDLVRRLVLDTAERLIKEEIEKIKGLAE